MKERTKPFPLRAVRAAALILAALILAAGLEWVMQRTLRKWTFPLILR